MSLGKCTLTYVHDGTKEAPVKQEAKGPAAAEAAAAAPAKAAVAKKEKKKA